MVNSQFVAKSNFIAFVKGVIRNKDTGLLSILTESKRSVLLKFSQGVLIHAYSRSRDIGDVVQVINESDRIKFDMVPIPPESGTEIMPGNIFLQLLQTGNSIETTEAAISSSGSASASTKRSEIYSAKSLLESAAAEYVGMVAEVIVEEALEISGSLEEAIDNIAKAIPDPEQSALFRAEARKQTRLISM